MATPIIITVSGMIFLIVFLKMRVKGACDKAAIFKSIVSLGFIGVAVSAILLNKFNGPQSEYSIIVLSGLFFGLLGDIWLDLKLAHKESDKIYTYAGMICFMIGHTFYITGLFRYYYPIFSEKTKVTDIVLLIAIPVAALIFMIFSEKPMKVNYGEYKAVTSVYTVFLALFPTIVLTFVRLADFKNIALIILSAASILFVISDAILTGTYFGKGKDRPIDIITNHVTYYFAQYLIALSLCFLEIE